MKAVRTDSQDRNASPRHPISWFSALLRGVETRDPVLVEAAREGLRKAGYHVITMPAPFSESGAA